MQSFIHRRSPQRKVSASDNSWPLSFVATSENSASSVLLFVVVIVLHLVFFSDSKSGLLEMRTMQCFQFSRHSLTEIAWECEKMKLFRSLSTQLMNLGMTNFNTPMGWLTVTGQSPSLCCVPRRCRCRSGAPFFSVPPTRALPLGRNPGGMFADAA